MNLYRDNSNPPTVPAAEVPSVVVPQPDTVPWSFRTRDDFPELMNRWGLGGLSSVGVEVGTYRGAFASHILKNWDGTLHVVDPWEYQPEHRDLLNTLDQAKNEALCRYELSGWVKENRCVIHKGYSVEVASHPSCPSNVDWVYIDALHDYDSVTADLNAWAPLIRSGGALCGHDYLDHVTGPTTVTEFGVKRAVLDWCSRNGYQESDLLITPDDGYPTYAIRLR